MRVLVSGHSGFTGQYIKAELEKHNHEVYGLASDLMDYDALAQEVQQIQPDWVIHLAAVTFVAHANALDFYRVNVLGTYHFLQAIHQHCPQIKSVLIVSSANVYGNSEQAILSEDAPTKPSNDYAVSKLAMENMAQLWVDRLPLFIVRPFNYTGVGQKENFLIPKITAHFKKKSSIIELGNLDVWREFGDVRVVAEIYRKLLTLCPVGKTINICTGEAYSLREVVTMATSFTGHDISIQVNPAFVRAHEVRTLKGDNSLLRSLLKEWNEVSFKDTLSWMLV